MEMKTILILFVTSILLITACEDSEIEDDVVISQDGTVIISSATYKATKTNYYSISNAEIVGDTLRITVSSSGCSGDTWIAKLIDSGAIAESNPVQRFAKISLENIEACASVPSKEFVFDLSLLRVGYDRLSLNLEGWNDGLLYRY